MDFNKLRKNIEFKSRLFDSVCLILERLKNEEVDAFTEKEISFYEILKDDLEDNMFDMFNLLGDEIVEEITKWK